MKTIGEWLEVIREFLEIPLLKLKDTEITLWTLLYLIIVVILLFYLTAKLKNWLTDHMLARFSVEVGIRAAIGSIVRYFLIVVGFIIILQTAGIDLTALNVLAGAVGLGLGFGLQNIVSNFISGIILLFERPIKVGDRIEVGDVNGAVQSINARSTRVLTNDNISIIVPNSKFVTENIVNWIHDDWKVRFRVPVIVAIESDAHLVEKVLLEAAKKVPDVLDQPAPGVRFIKFGDTGLHFELRIWSTSLVHRRGTFISAINFAVYDKFKEYGIELNTPELDLHVSGGSLEVTIRKSDMNSLAEESKDGKDAEDPEPSTKQE